MINIFLFYVNVSSFLVFLVIFLSVYYLWNHIYNVKVNIPGPRPWPILGNLPMPWGVQNPNKLFLDLRERYGDMVYFTLGSQPFVLCFGYKTVYDVLVSNSDKTKHRPTWLRTFVKILRNESGKQYVCTVKNKSE